MPRQHGGDRQAGQHRARSARRGRAPGRGPARSARTAAARRRRRAAISPVARPRGAVPRDLPDEVDLGPGVGAPSSIRRPNRSPIDSSRGSCAGASKDQAPPLVVVSALRAVRLAPPVFARPAPSSSRPVRTTRISAKPTTAAMAIAMPGSCGRSRGCRRRCRRRSCRGRCRRSRRRRPAARWA